MIDNAAAIIAGTAAATPSSVGSLREDYMLYTNTALDATERGASVIRWRQNVFSGINRGAEPAYKAALEPLRAELKLLAARWEAYSKHGEGALGANALPPLTEEDALTFFAWADARLDALRESELELRKLANARCDQMNS